MQRKAMTLILLVDQSGSMMINNNIEKVNGAVRDLIPRLQEVSSIHDSVEPKLAVLAYSSGCRWATCDSKGNVGAASPWGFTWRDLEPTGLTEMGAAFAELESKLSTPSFMANAGGCYAPVIILLSDGRPTDYWQGGLMRLKKNEWFRAATKIAVAVDDSDTAVLAEFTGSMDAVLQVDSQKDDLRQILCRLAVVSADLERKAVEAVNEVVNETVPEDIPAEEMTDEDPEPTWEEAFEDSEEEFDLYEDDTEVAAEEDEVFEAEENEEAFFEELENCAEELQAYAEELETNAEEAELRAVEAEIRAEEADIRAEEAETRAEEAESRAEEAETRAEEAESRAEEAEARAEEAEARAKEAEAMAQEAMKRADDNKGGYDPWGDKW